MNAKDQSSSLDSGAPESGTPERGTPERGARESGGRSGTGTTSSNGTRNGARNGARDGGWWQGSKRFLRYKFVVPLMRSQHPPEYTARGVAIGVFVGLTPLVGLQMYIIFMMWLVARMSPRFDFHMVQGLIWVWISNIFTLVPLYYAFYVTGQAMLGRFADITGYEAFAKLLDTSAWESESFWEGMVMYFNYILETFGLPLAIGWVPYGLVGGWLGYKLAIRIVEARRGRLRQKAEARNARDRADGAAAATGDQVS